MNKNWNILQTNSEFHGVFQATPMIAFKRSKNLQEIIGGHTVKQGKVFKKSLYKLNEKSMPCNSTRPSLCCTKIVNTLNVYELTNEKNIYCISQNNLQKSIYHLFNGMYVMKNPMRWKIRDSF